MKKRKVVKIIILCIVFLILFSIWFNLAGMSFSGFIGEFEDIEKYIEKEKVFPKKILDITEFTDRELWFLEVNFDIAIEEIIEKNQKLYLHNKRVWLVKPKGQCKWLLIPFYGLIEKKYSYEIYAKYLEVMNKKGK